MMLNFLRMVGDKDRKNSGFILMINEPSAHSVSKASLFIASFSQLSRPSFKETGVKDQERIMLRGE